MGGALYDKGREAFLGPATGQINWFNDTIKASLVSSSYVPDLTSHQFVPSIHAHTASLTAQTVGSRTVTNGVADGDDVSFTAVAANFVFDYVALFKDSGSPNTSQLIALISGSGMPLTSSGADISIVWSNSANKIFKL